jgi:hypothetical protein
MAQVQSLKTPARQPPGNSMSRIALMAHPRVRMAAAGLAVMCVLAMAGVIIGRPGTVMGEESLSDNLRREVRTSLARSRFFDLTIPCTTARSRYE